MAEPHCIQCGYVRPTHPLGGQAVLGDEWVIHPGKERDFLTCSPECRLAGGYPERPHWLEKTQPTSAGLGNKTAAAAGGQVTAQLTTGLEPGPGLGPMTTKACRSATSATKTSTISPEPSEGGSSSSSGSGSGQWWDV